MEKIRVYELAKELKMTSKELVAKLKDLDVGIKSHMSILSGETLETVKNLFNEEREVKNSIKKEKHSTNSKDKVIRKQMTVKNDILENDEIEVFLDDEENLKKEKFYKKKKIDSEFKKKPSNSHKKKNKDKQKQDNNINNDEKKNEVKSIEIEKSILVRDLADKMKINTTELISKLITLGVMANQNQELDFDTALLIADEFGFNVKLKETNVIDNNLESLDYEDKEEDLIPRPPVVTVMGHVDHGKTSTLDAIRNTRVTKSEAGGITQHIGASTININGQKVVFLDTPGHEAFTAMRARGANITDITVLVVAADDGIMPQTVEAINHSKNAGVEIIVAINKMDKEGANPDRIKQELTEYGLVPEDWGGDTITVPISAKKNEGIDELLEMILMVAEMQEYKANPNRKAVGTIIEAKLDKGKGPVATVLVQKGTLKFGDAVVSGCVSGKIRAMFDDKGKSVKKAKPSIPVQILGLSDVPESGDKIYVVDDEKIARNIAQKEQDKAKEEKVKKQENLSLDALFDSIKDGSVKDLNLVIKTDVKGTIDAVANSLLKLSNEEVKVNIIHSGVGGISESDVLLASTSNAIIIGFNVRPGVVAEKAAKDQGVEIKTYRVIYDAIDDIKNAINGMLKPVYTEEVIGRIDVRAVFKVPGVGNVAGVYVTSGKVTRSSKVRLLRNDIVITEGDISSLKRFKDDVKELNQGYEGGLGIENYNDIKEGDIIEAYVMKEVKRDE